MGESDSTQSSGDSRQTSGTPLIFISHDSRDADLAEAFAKLVHRVSAGVLKCFRSSDKTGTQGIEYGTDWYPKIMTQLAQASDVVCLLTARSVERPWILYEAGVAKGRSNEVLVHGLALGIPMSTLNTGPFAQFQNCAEDETSITTLVMQLVSRIPGADPDRSAVSMLVTEFKKAVTETLAKIASVPKQISSTPQEDDDRVAKLFEEVKVMF